MGVPAYDSGLQRPDPAEGLAGLRRRSKVGLWRRRLPLAAFVPAACLVMVGCATSDAATSFAGSFSRLVRVAAPAHGHGEPSRVGRLAASQRSKLEGEATAASDFFKSVVGFFGGGDDKPTEEQIAAEEKRKEVSLRHEEELKSLRLAVVAGTDDDGAPQRRPAPIGILQEQAKQSLAIFAAPREQALQDLLLSMRIAAREFEERNLLVVPALVSLEDRTLLELSPTMQNSRFVNRAEVALPAPKTDKDRLAWGELLAAEFEGARDQGYGDQAEAQGLALLVNSAGQIVRRGVGRPDWQVIFNELGM